MKQSSIEWLFEQYELVGMLTTAQVQKAKAMHKEEIIAARVDGDTWSTAYKEMRENYAELYYNETFNTK